jgi:Flp pilus assembly protein TadD
MSADALAASQRAVELAPDLADAYVARGNALLMHGEADEAQRAFERATLSIRATSTLTTGSRSSGSRAVSTRWP